MAHAEAHIETNPAGAHAEAPHKVIDIEKLSDLKKKYLVKAPIDRTQYWPINRSPTSSTSILSMIMFGSIGASLIHVFTWNHLKSPRKHHFHVFLAASIGAVTGYAANYYRTNHNYEKEWKEEARINKEKAKAADEERRRIKKEKEEKAREAKKEKEAKKNKDKN